MDRKEHRIRLRTNATRYNFPATLPSISSLEFSGSSVPGDPSLTEEPESSGLEIALPSVMRP